MTPEEEFREESERGVSAQASDVEFQRSTNEWMVTSLVRKYSYNFTWLGRPVIQYPQDLLAMQEIVHAVRPDLIIETGIAHGGSLIFYASLLELNAQCGGPTESVVVGIDIDIRPHNRAAIESHPLFNRIQLVEGSSTSPDVVDLVRREAEVRERILVCLDSDHSRDHVLAELEAYAPLVGVGSYCVVFDTIVEFLPPEYFSATDRRCAPGDSPMTAVEIFLGFHPEFAQDTAMTDKLMTTVAPGGYLRRVR